MWRALLELIAAPALSVPLHAGDTGTDEPTGPTMPASDPSSVPVNYSILRPGLSAKYTVVTVAEALSLVALGGHFSSLRSIELRKAVSREGFDPWLNLAHRPVALEGTATVGGG